MKKAIDCLLIGYLGYNYSKINETLEKNGLSSNKMEKDFNAAIAYLGTYLNKRNVTFDYINYIEDDMEMLKEKLETLDISSIGLSTTYCTSIQSVESIVAFIKKVNPNKDVKIILGGAYITKLINDSELQDNMVLQYVLKKIGADIYINSFQGEETLYKVIMGLKIGATLDDIPNILYQYESKYIRNELVPEDNKLEDNIVDWSLFADRVGRTVPVRTAISCPFSCSYCSYHINAGKYRYVDVDIIEKELNSIDKLPNVKTVHFIDDTFNVPVDRFKKILRMIIRNKYKFNWCSFIRCQFLDEEAVQLMKESKCIGTFLGIESGNQYVLNNMNKRVKLEELVKGNQLLEKYGIQRFGSFIVGFPGETEETVNDTIQFIKAINLKYYGVATWYYDTRTPIHELKDKYKLIGKDYNWKHETMDFNRAMELNQYVRNQLTTSIHFVQDPTWLFQLIDEKVDINQILEIVPQDPALFTVHNFK